MSHVDVARLRPLRLVDQVAERPAEALLQDVRVPRFHVGAAPLPAHDEALHHELADGLPDGRAAYLEFGGQFVFAQQLAANGIDPVLDALPEDPRDLVVKRERLRVVNHLRTLSSMADRPAQPKTRVARTRSSWLGMGSQPRDSMRRKLSSSWMTSVNDQDGTCGTPSPPLEYQLP